MNDVPKTGLQEFGEALAAVRDAYIEAMRPFVEPVVRFLARWLRRAGL